MEAGNKDTDRAVPVRATPGIQVFLSYHRAQTEYLAPAIKWNLASKGADVFLDVETINAGRFENVIFHEIVRRDHFIVILTPDSLPRLASAEDWVRREILLAGEMRKNIVPILTKGLRLSDLPPEFPEREVISGLNALTLDFDLFEACMTVLYDRYLTNPTLEVRDYALAEEHYAAGFAAQEREDWATAEAEYLRATRHRRRPEYFQGLSVLRFRQDRPDEALMDIETAILLDPYGRELLKNKMWLLERMDLLREAVQLVPQLSANARAVAERHAIHILAVVEGGGDVASCILSIPGLAVPHDHLPRAEMLQYVVHDLITHSPEPTRKRLEEALAAWEA